MKNEDKIQELEQEIEKLYSKTRQLEQAIGFLLNKAQLKSTEAVEFTELFPTWEIGVNYVKNTYLTHGIDEEGSKRLYQVKMSLTSEKGKYPGKDTGHYTTDELYTPIQKRKDEE